MQTCCIGSFESAGDLGQVCCPTPKEVPGRVRKRRKRWLQKAPCSQSFIRASDQNRETQIQIVLGDCASSVRAVGTGRVQCPGPRSPRGRARAGQRDISETRELKQTGWPSQRDSVNPLDSCPPSAPALPADVAKPQPTPRPTPPSFPAFSPSLPSTLQFPFPTCIHWSHKVLPELFAGPSNCVSCHSRSARRSWLHHEKLLPSQSLGDHSFLRPGLCPALPLRPAGAAIRAYGTTTEDPTLALPRSENQPDAASWGRVCISKEQADSHHFVVSNKSSKIKEPPGRAPLCPPGATSARGERSSSSATPSLEGRLHWGLWLQPKGLQGTQFVHNDGPNVRGCLNLRPKISWRVRKAVLEAGVHRTSYALRDSGTWTDPGTGFIGTEGVTLPRPLKTWTLQERGGSNLDVLVGRLPFLRHPQWTGRPRPHVPGGAQRPGFIHTSPLPTPRAALALTVEIRPDRAWGLIFLAFTSAGFERQEASSELVASATTVFQLGLSENPPPGCCSRHPKVVVPVFPDFSTGPPVPSRCQSAEGAEQTSLIGRAPQRPVGLWLPDLSLLLSSRCQASLAGSDQLAMVSAKPHVAAATWGGSGEVAAFETFATLSRSVLVSLRGLDSFKTEPLQSSVSFTGQKLPLGTELSNRDAAQWPVAPCYTDLGDYHLVRKGSKEGASRTVLSGPDIAMAVGDLWLSLEPKCERQGGWGLLGTLDREKSKACPLVHLNKTRPRSGQVVTPAQKHRPRTKGNILDVDPRGVPVVNHFLPTDSAVSPGLTSSIPPQAVSWGWMLTLPSFRGHRAGFQKRT
ncbi:hypothetical protein Cadr_000023029 [Camelus dromedarius]|uniref:Uncharacterized protein n=1 Tax=Camelus dromedarius TaxID=9838 RepID=A0A5N4CJ63_CAMDR|nr:hypothetical protein Cadr_000023029 [Camelus dromedarius]